MKKLRIAVLMGGTSSEREVSLSTGRQIIASLDRSKYEVVGIDTAALSGSIPPKRVTGNELKLDQGSDLVPISVSDLSSVDTGRPDVAFIALHGKGGEDGSIQGLLELLGIQYTGSGILASALAMDKSMAKKTLASVGIPVPKEILVTRSFSSRMDAFVSQVGADLGYPVIVKPNSQGSTIGCTKVGGPEDLAKAVEHALSCDNSALIEQMIVGLEITVGVLGNEEPVALPIIEIEVPSGFYDYEAKYVVGGSSHVIPARLETDVAAKAEDYALRCHRALGCRGMSRTDMIICDGEPVVLEVNTIPGMTPTSLLPDAARHAGIEFSDLLDRIIQSAINI